MKEWICPKCNEYYFGWSNVLSCSRCGYKEIRTGKDISGDESCENEVKFIFQKRHYIEKDNDE